MFKELLELGERLNLEGKLPPVSYYTYDEPVSWVLHIWRDDAEKFDIRRTEINSKPRPFSGRTSGAQAHLASDEASYVLGKGSDSKKKRRQFMLLLRNAERHAKTMMDQQLAQSIHSARSILVQNKCSDHPPVERDKAEGMGFYPDRRNKPTPD
ncbi:MAG: type I-C CRISPR-associated protein Cas8c/Csd1 [Nitrospira sp.]|nr:type I-C CRISPR-associated protein Cas8c/Csd1 [Nitrospira sp.]